MLYLSIALLGLRVAPPTCPASRLSSAQRVAPRVAPAVFMVDDGGAMNQVLSDAKEELEQSADEAAMAFGKAERAAVETKRKAAEEAVASLRAAVDAAGDSHPVAKVLAKKGSAPAQGKVAKALKKPPGTLAIVPGGAPLTSVSQGGFDLDDPNYLSKQFRDGGAAAVLVDVRPEMRLRESALSETVEEQELARGEFPGPLHVVARGDFVDELQLAQAKADGASAVVLNLYLAGEEQTGALMAAATELGLEPFVRVGDEEEVQAAVRLGAPIVCFGDVGLERADELRQLLPAGVLSVCDVLLREAVRDAWRVRDMGFNAAIIGKPMLDMAVRERAPPDAVLKAMLSKGSVKFGLGMQLGRLEGAKEQLGSLSM